jgi:predicted neuraminidase
MNLNLRAPYKPWQLRHLQRWALGLLACISLFVLDQMQRPAPAPPAQALIASGENANARTNSQPATWVTAAPRPPAPTPTSIPTSSAHHACDALALTPAQNLRWVAQGALPMPKGAAAAHASALLTMPADSPVALMAFWFSGERESGPQVQIAASALDRASGTWSTPRFVVNRHVLAQQLGAGVRRLGNPVAWLDAQQRIHLFVVGTGWGGWGASRIVHLQQTHADTAAATPPATPPTFSPVRTLPLSWLWNISFLLRNAPLPLADGGMVLPVHFEMGMKYPSALRMDAQGQLLGMVRMSQSRMGNTQYLQPTLLTRTPQHWIALLRDQRENGKIGAMQSLDAGTHWSDLPHLNLDNPDAAVAALNLGPKQMLLVHNPSTKDRTRLDLSYSQDGVHWHWLHTLAQGAPKAEFSYPFLTCVGKQVWISYTAERKTIAWQRFAPAQESP